MPICIECRYPLRALYTTYSKADDRSLGKGVRLTQCPRCKRFGDKYVEHDFVVLFIDLVLIKPQVYRHLLFNRLGREDDRFDPSIIRLGILLLLFDVYLTWARIEKAAPQPFSTDPSSPGTASAIETPSLLSSQPLVLQYIFFLGLNPPTSAPSPAQPSIASNNPTNTIPLLPHYPHPTPLSTALLVSSCTKLFPLLLIIWDYDLPSSASAVSWAVIVNNIAALEILMDCGYVRAAVLVGVGAAVRAAVGEVVLASVGLRGIANAASGGGGGGLWGWGVRGG
ncbi:Arv1-like family-domain-containing protein [Macrophomina phaseolina]|uniref:Protein ARV n=1 Tax=Macrophomina phaseolina TaxID=35725 RepID=A0ABQ8G9G7_9PEZI|nr:Arv1-like family-domain-containing protein [Macrophomina phaseolina]